jgi:hypothetical protein
VVKSGVKGDEMDVQREATAAATRRKECTKKY